MTNRRNAPSVAVAAFGMILAGCTAPVAHDSSATASQSTRSLQDTSHAGEPRPDTTASEAAAHGDPALRSLAQVSTEQARTAALAVRPGTVAEWELERESGGSGLRYSFVIRQNGANYEVGVDARDGRILENAAEGRNPD